jgi:ribonuclease-3
MGGNAFEALVGALYLDQGYDACMKFVEKRILAEIINIDKVAYKEVNFKSKLIEWGQKNRIKIEYELLSEERGEKGSPKFTYRAIIEGIEAGIGVDYSKKESQQKASREALLLLRKDSQFLDSVFAAKAEKTRMEEMPVALVPEV